MSYGFKFDEMKRIYRTEPIKKEWGHYIKIPKNDFYDLEQQYLKKGGKMPLHYIKKESILYVESGSVLLTIVDKKGVAHSIKLLPGHNFDLPPGTIRGLFALEESYVYLFSDNQEEEPYYIQTQEEANSIIPMENDENILFEPGKTTDFREKYWGSIETITSKSYCGKKIVMKKGMQNSLEFHCNKYETYFIHSGKVKVGLRIGRGENKSVILEKGDIFNIPPGLMHMKIALEDSIIFEISTKDDDVDSHIVEDGQKYFHKED